MDILSKYWRICCISPASEKIGYKYRLVSTAKEFIRKKFFNFSNEEIQDTLLSYFHRKLTATNATIVAQAGLCLRCYVSESILKACKRIDNLFGGEKHFTYQDLLPFVLNDDGKTLIILDKDGKNHLILDNKDKTQTTAYKFFSVKVLQTFKPDSPFSMSLDNWAYLQTKQNQDLKDFLSEFGFKHLSDWALLNRARPKQLELLSERDRHLVEVFHAVYRRDRRQQRQKEVRLCPDPSSSQLKEILARLQERDIVVNTTSELIKELKQIATQLRHYDIWSYREPLEIYNSEAGSYVLRADLPNDYLNELDIEQREILEFLHQQLKLALAQGIEQEIRSRITKLEKSKKYAPIAQKFIPGLQLYYYQGLSLKEIAPLLGMTSWDQARRVLNPGDLLNKVRELTVQQILNRSLEKAQEKGLSKIPPEPDYLKTLAEQIEAFVDAEVFQEAVEEIRAGKNREMKSLYAQQLCLYFANQEESATPRSLAQRCA